MDPTGKTITSSDFDTRCSKALKENSVYFNEGHNFGVLLRRLDKIAVTKAGVRLRLGARHGLLDHSEHVMLLPWVFLPTQLRGLSALPLTSCVKTVADLSVLASVFCDGDIQSARDLAASVPASWPFPDAVDVPAPPGS